MLKTAREVDVKIKDGKPGRWAVGDGAYLQIARGAKRNTAAWILRYQNGGVAHHVGLGPFALVSLAEARQRAREARKQLLDGIDPLKARRALRERARLTAARAITFKSAAEQYIAAHEVEWKNRKHAAQWTASLSAYTYPLFGDVAVADVDTALVLKALEPIWRMKSETAGRVRSRIENILDWARVRGFREGENPARWKGHLDKLLPARGKIHETRHHAALPYSELPTFMADLRGRHSISARALEFTILTAARTGETIGAIWPEIDLRNAIWIVPPKRMKAGKEHRVPLASAAIHLLEQTPRLNSNVHLFPGRDDKALSNMAMLELLRGVRPGYTPHGFRSTFRDWAADCTSYANHVVEMALAHAIGDKVEASYRRGDLFEKRRSLMQDWAAYCLSLQ